MTDNQLQKLAALAEAATPGPWLVSIVDNVNAAFCRVAPDVTAHVCCYTDNRGNDIAFISAARDAVPELLAEAADLRRQLAEALSDAPAHLRNECSRLRREIQRRGRTARATEAQLAATEDEAAELRRQLAEYQALLERISLAAGADDATPAAILAALTE